RLRAGGGLPRPLPRWRLVSGKQGTSGPVLRAWRTPVGSAADRGEVTAGGVIFSPADRGAAASGRVALPPADRGKLLADLVPLADYQTPKAGEVLLPPHHHVVRARPCVNESGFAQLVVTHDQVAQPIRRVRRSQTIDDAQVRPGNDYLVRCI